MADIEIDDVWRTAARERACKLFPNQGLQPVAQLMASSHRYAIDYIEQAPAIVLAATRGHAPRSRNERSYLTGQIAEFCRRGDQLRNVMRAYDLPLPIRKLKGSALSPNKWPVLFRLKRLDNSTLSQIIPEQSAQQQRWLRALDGWLDRMGRRNAGDGTLFFNWAAVAFCRIGNSEIEFCRDLADFAAANRDTFNEGWSVAQAQRAQEEWHLSLARRSTAAEQMAKSGVKFDTPIDYAPLPAAIDLNGLSFQALQSGEDLFVEGAAMRHCVATYISAVVSGQSRIYSIRDQGKRVATMELRFTEMGQTRRDFVGEGGRTISLNVSKPQGLALHQLKGPCNARPPKRVQQAASAFVALIRDPTYSLTSNK